MKYKILILEFLFVGSRYPGYFVTVQQMEGIKNNGIKICEKFRACQLLAVSRVAFGITGSIVQSPRCLVLVLGLGPH